jgi:hypothetical protein
MTQQTATTTNKAIGGLLPAAVASGVFAASAVGLAPAANATCASFWGIGNGNGCTSSIGGVAIAIGTGATAEANGFFTTAISIGSGAEASANGLFSYASNVGTGGPAIAGNRNGGDVGNIAISFGDNDVNASGVGNNASNFGGTGNDISAVNTDGVGFNRAFGLGSSNTVVSAFPGPFATAGSILQSGVTVTKQGPGFNINGIRVGGAAAPAKASTTGKAAALSSSKKATTGSAAVAKHATKK